MRNIKLTIQYDGTLYHGWQSQKNGNTIQEVMEESLLRITGRRPNLIGAGRTDRGVHALGQVASFKTETHLDALSIKRALNALLPEDIMVLDASDADASFHARYSATGKAYFYTIANTADVPVFLRRFAWRLPLKLDIEAMSEACGLLKGRHDFSSFRGSGCGAKNTVREVTRLRVEDFEGPKFLTTVFDCPIIKITVGADSFLRHMVRNIAGTLVEVGRGRIRPESVGEILKSKDRRLAGPTAPARGLFLENVSY